jgi:hypothetical protein
MFFFLFYINALFTRKILLLSHVVCESKPVVPSGTSPSNASVNMGNLGTTCRWIIHGWVRESCLRPCSTIEPREKGIHYILGWANHARPIQNYWASLSCLPSKSLDRYTSTWAKSCLLHTYTVKYTSPLSLSSERLIQSPLVVFL